MKKKKRNNIFYFFCRIVVLITLLVLMTGKAYAQKEVDTIIVEFVYNDKTVKDFSFFSFSIRIYDSLNKLIDSIRLEGMNNYLLVPSNIFKENYQQKRCDLIILAKAKEYIIPNEPYFIFNSRKWVISVKEIKRKKRSIDAKYHYIFNSAGFWSSGNG